ncbi:MAG: helix-turn-helix domain-containing protein [Pseudarthrobacter sp.]
MARQSRGSSGEWASQADRVLAALLEGKTITPLEALWSFGCYRLAARVHDLRRRGIPVMTELVRAPNGTRVARYYVPAQARRKLLQRGARDRRGQCRA